MNQFSSVTQSCPTLCDPMNHSMTGLPVHHQLPEFTQTHVHRVSDAIQPSHPLLSPSPPAPNPSQHQSLFQWVNSSHEVASFSIIPSKEIPGLISLRMDWLSCICTSNVWEFHFLPTRCVVNLVNFSHSLCMRYYLAVIASHSYIFFFG